jgi:DNA-directed RNA polymerase specialized sigma subunit
MKPTRKVGLFAPPPEKHQSSKKLSQRIRKEPATEENERTTGITIEEVCELLLMIDRKNAVL